MDVVRQKFAVPFEYPVYFGRGLLSPERPELGEYLRTHLAHPGCGVQVFIDSGLAAAQPGLIDRVTAYFTRAAPEVRLVGTPTVVPGGEAAKNSRVAAETVMESIADNHLCRQSYVLVFGGGSTLDIVGLAASLVHRGVRLIRFPTTTLSQDDSGVGVKTGIDAYGMKNFAGTFAPPFAVFIDFDFLKTLPWRYWIGGVAEAFKVALIRDADFFDLLCRRAAALGRRDEDAIEDVVKRSALLHLDHIRTSGDPFEFGSAKPLDFGHWSAHRVEILSGYEIGHGEAVALGVALDSYYAWKTGLLEESVFMAIVDAFQSCGLPVWSSVLERRMPDGRLALLVGLDEFREHLGGRLTVTLPGPVGCMSDVNEMDEGIIEEGIKALGKR